MDEFQEAMRSALGQVVCRSSQGNSSTTGFSDLRFRARNQGTMGAGQDDSIIYLRKEQLWQARRKGKMNTEATLLGAVQF